MTPLMTSANNLWDVAILLVRPRSRDPPPSCSGGYCQSLGIVGFSTLVLEHPSR